MPKAFLGRYLNDVRTEGGGGFKNYPILRTNSTDRLREMRMKGGGGSKNPKILRTSFKYGPQNALNLRIQAGYFSSRLIRSLFVFDGTSITRIKRETIPISGGRERNLLIINYAPDQTQTLLFRQKREGARAGRRRPATRSLPPSLFPSDRPWQCNGDVAIKYTRKADTALARQFLF